MLGQTSFPYIKQSDSDNSNAQRFRAEGPHTKMAFAYHICTPERHVRVVGRGAASTQQCIEAVHLVTSDPLCLPEFTALLDLTELEYRPEDEGEIVEVAEAFEALEARFLSKVAIVARGCLLFTAELLAAHVRDTGKINIRVFLDTTSAESFCRDGQCHTR